MKSGVAAGSFDRLPAVLVVLELDDTPAPIVTLRVDLGPSSYIIFIGSGNKRESIV